MATHAVFTLSLTNPDRLAQYREVAAQALAKHGGAVVQASGSITRLDGDQDTPTMAAVLSFPDADAALAWHADPELAETHDLRRGAGNTNLILLG